jgi:hypothetical protein
MPIVMSNSASPRVAGATAAMTPAARMIAAAIDSMRSNSSFSQRPATEAATSGSAAAASSVTTPFAVTSCTRNMNATTPQISRTIRERFDHRSG